jgi:type IV pilus assembly protein PilY1
MDMKKYLTHSRISFGLLVLFYYSICLISIGASSSTASWRTPTANNYIKIPPFVNASAPPMVMLVMGRDHTLYYEAYNDASDLNEDGMLDTFYNPEIDYYGYFDSYKYYIYSTTRGRFEPAGVTENKKVPSSGSYWSGDYLNYLTMARIDVMRKVLYGGYRAIDTATETVLERAYIPNDGHCWGKEYTSEAVDGYLISDYTPYPQPTEDSRHLFGSGSIVPPGHSNYAPLLRVKLNSPHRIWDWVSAENVDGILGNTIVEMPDADFKVLVQVGVSSFPDHRSEIKYGSGITAVYKPVGVLQRHGETNGMYFGLITGSYGNHLSGGVLRKNIRSITDEINLETGQFKYKTNSSINGIIKTIDNLRIIGFNHRIPNQSGNGYWDATIYSRPISEGENYMWGNPVAEMMYETLRYFAGENKTPAFSASVSNGNDRGLDLPMETWVDPYTVFPNCSKPIMLLISDINPSYDSEHLPGSYFGGGLLSFGDFNARTEANLISTVEGIGGNDYYVGQSGVYTDTSCSAKSVGGFGEVRGLCPEEPTKMGSYYSAAVAHYGARTGLNPLSDEKVSTYAVALASPLPQIEVAMDGGDFITLIPFAKTVYSTGGGGVSPDRGRFQPTCAIVDFYVDSITPTSGRFRVTYEHAEQGSDFDMDALITYEYVKTAENTLEVTISSLETTWGGGSKQHFGYIISGTAADGVYLEIKNATQPNNGDRDYYLDTPGSCGPNQGVHDMCWMTNTYLPNIKTRIFSVGSGSAATLLKNPLYYAAKWGGFDDENDNDIPDLESEWDKTGDGVPDTYFYRGQPARGWRNSSAAPSRTFWPGHPPVPPHRWSPARVRVKAPSTSRFSTRSCTRSHMPIQHHLGRAGACPVGGCLRQYARRYDRQTSDWTWRRICSLYSMERIRSDKYRDVNANGIFDEEDLAAGPVINASTKQRASLP